MKRYVAGFMFDQYDRDSVLLIQKNKPAWQKGKWNAIGGKIEGGETPEDAMVREFREETGLFTSYSTTQPERPLEQMPGIWRPFVILTNEVEGYRVHFFRAIGPIQDAKSMTDEQVLQVEWPFAHDWDVIPNLWWLVPMAKDHDIGFPLHIEDYGGT